MKLEIMIYRMSHGFRAEKELVEHFCVFDESRKRPTRGRIKKLLARCKVLGSNWWAFVHKDEKGHYHAMKSGERNKNTYHFFWYYIELIPCQETTNTKQPDFATTVTDTPTTSAERRSGTTIKNAASVAGTCGGE